MFSVPTSVLAVLVSLLSAIILPSLLKTKDLVVDLGYQQNQGFVINNSLVTFRNVRYAAPPEGELRFREPQPPPSIPSSVPINASDVFCPQAFPGVPDIPPDPRATEDCLVLDVLLTQDAWDRRKRSSRPVLVWIHGGAFDFGWKDWSGAGHGLVSRSVQYHKDGIILVSINYRLGLFGWINGEGVTSNAGLLDQRLALDWVQEYIHLFGGDAARVTVMGESSGGSSIEAHITAYGGANDSVPFRGAIAQSPYLVPSYPDPRSTVDGVLSFANISSLDALRAISTSDLQTLNARIVAGSPFGGTTFSIVPDTSYVPAHPNHLLSHRRFDRSLTIVSAHNCDEGALLVPPGITTNEDYTAYLTALIPPLATSPAALARVTQTLYPAIFDGTQGYTDQTQRAARTVADAALVCNARALATAPFERAPWSYVFSGPPGVHGADLSYTFYDFDAPGVNATVAEVLQGYIVTMAVERDPNAGGLPEFPRMKEGAVLNVGREGVYRMDGEGPGTGVDERCGFWLGMGYLAG